MATQVQFRRGTTTQNNAFTGAIGEISYDTEVKTLRLHDGTTAGGGSIVTINAGVQTLTNKTLSTGSAWQGNAVALAYGGTGSNLTAVAGAVPYSGASGFGLTAAGTSGQLLSSGGSSSPTWISASSLTVGTASNATTATNIAGGSAGQLMIQQDTGLTTFITAGASGTFLQSAGAGYAPTWAAGQVTIGSTAIALGATSTTLNGLNVLAATGTSHWTLPVGTTAQRPGTPAQGMIRYNTSISGFEGYASGAWSSLGGVKSVDALTYIIAETSAGASNGELEFYVEDASTSASTKAMGITHTGVVIAGNLTVNGTTTTINATTLTVDDKNIELGSVDSPTDSTAAGGGITLKGATDKIIDWNSSTGWRIEDDIATRRLFTGTTSSTNPTSILAIASATYRSGELTIQVANLVSSTNSYKILKLFFVHDGTNVTLSENYLTTNEIQTATTNTTFTASISSGTLTIFATASTGTSTIKGQATLFKV